MTPLRLKLNLRCFSQIIWQSFLMAGFLESPICPVYIGRRVVQIATICAITAVYNTALDLLLFFYFSVVLGIREVLDIHLRETMKIAWPFRTADINLFLYPLLYVEETFYFYLNKDCFSAYAGFFACRRIKMVWNCVVCNEILPTHINVIPMLLITIFHFFYEVE